MSGSDFLLLTGLHLKEMAIGLNGSIVAICMLRRPRPWNILTTVVMGVFAANYFGPPIASVLRTPYYEATIFGTGVAGGAICFGGLWIIKSCIARFANRLDVKDIWQ